MRIRVKKLHEDAVVPKYASQGASGFDFHALEDTILLPGETALVRTGLAIAVGFENELQVRPRSGLSLKTPLRVANAPGTVDSDYRGEICVIMTNTAVWSHSSSWIVRNGENYNQNTQFIKKGDRIAQGVICPVNRVAIDEVESLDETERGSGGFGSTGV